MSGAPHVPDVDLPTSASMAVEQAVPLAVAGLLESTTDEGLLEALTRLVERSGGTVTGADRPVAEALRSLPDELVVADGRQWTLGPVLRALCAAAHERATGDLRPRRAPGTPGAASGPVDEIVLALDLGDLSRVRAQVGEPGARWLVTRLQRTLRSLLRPDDRALRYPAGRLLVLLRDEGTSRAPVLARRVQREWNASLGHAGRVTAQQAPVHGRDVAAALCRLR